MANKIQAINPFIQQYQAQPLQGPSFGESQTIKGPRIQEAGVNERVFQASLQKFAQKANPFAAEAKPNFEGANHQVGLSPLGLGALGEEAIYTEKGRLGSKLNFAG